MPQGAVAMQHKTDEQTFAGATEGGPWRRQIVVLSASFGLSIVGLLGVGFSVATTVPLSVSSVVVLFSAVATLLFATIVLLKAHPKGADIACWEALQQASVAWQQALAEAEETKGMVLYERGRGALQAATALEPSDSLLRLAVAKANEAVEGQGWRAEAAYRSGVLATLHPFAVPAISQAVWAQMLWQVWAIGAAVLAAFVGWQVVKAETSRALLYAVSGGALGASFYNLRTLAEHVAVYRDYSPRFWVDYLTRPLLGGVLGAVVYAFAVGLAWTLTMQSPMNPQAPKVGFALGFLSGYALRSVLLWLNNIAKSVFRSPAEGT